MYRVTLHDVFSLKGCPQSGLAAADWRIARGLVPTVHGLAIITLDLESETVCRHFRAATDESGDLTERGLRQAALLGTAFDRPEIEAAAVQPFGMQAINGSAIYAAPDADVIALIEAIDAAYRDLAARLIEKRLAEATAREAAEQLKLMNREAALLAEARAGKLYRQSAKGIQKVCDLM